MVLVSTTSLGGTITVNPNDDLLLISAVGTDSQVLCETDPLIDIVYQFSARSYQRKYVTGLPVGVTFSY